MCYYCHGRQELISFTKVGIRNMIIKRRRFNALLTKGVLAAVLPFPLSCSVQQNAGDKVALPMADFINQIPKAESHIHLQGCVTPELLLKFAKRNNISLTYKNEQDVETFIENSYGPDLADFVRVLTEITTVLKTEQDFYDTATDYFKRSAEQNLKYAEIYFDPQPALENGITMPAMMAGMNAARADAIKEYDIDCQWLMSFQRDRTPQSAMEVLELAEKSRENIVGVALDNLDTPGYPQRFRAVFDRAHEMGYKRTTHVDVGENDALDRVWGAIRDLKVDGRIDHGIDGLVDEQFRNHLIKNDVTLAVCPTLFFNKKPADSAYFRDVSKAVKFMLDNDMKVTISTDDPGIFDLNYIGDLYQLVQKQVNLTKQEIAQLARNSFEMLWIEQSHKDEYLNMLKPFETS